MPRWPAMIAAATLAATLTLAGAGPRAAGGAEGPAGQEAPASAERVRAAIEAVEKAPPADRRRAEAELAALGPGALEAVQRARQAAPDQDVRESLSRAAQLLVAAKLRPTLRTRADTGLTFDGQYEDLKGEGAETREALVLLLDDEETELGVRLAAAHALADLADPSILPRLRALESDPLLSHSLRNEVRTLMAILGDTHWLDHEIQLLERDVERNQAQLDELKRRSEERGLSRQVRMRLNVQQGPLLDQKLDLNNKLSNLYYRVRRYQKAVECYDRTLALLEGLLKQRPEGPPRLVGLLAQTYYNAACSLSLAGEVERARDFLRKAVRLDLTHLKNLDRDGDLRRVREAPGYTEFKRELEGPLEKRSL